MRRESRGMEVKRTTRGKESDLGGGRRALDGRVEREQNKREKEKKIGVENDSQNGSDAGRGFHCWCQCGHAWTVYKGSIWQHATTWEE